MNAADVERWGEQIRATARESFNDDGEVMPHAVCLGTVNPNTGETLPRPMTIPIVLKGYRGTEAEKDAVASFLGSCAKRCKALALVFISEAWLLRGVAGETYDEMHRNAYAHGPSLGDNPDRVEVLMASFQRLCSGGTTVYYADIIREAGKKARAGEFEGVRDPGASGRFVNIMEAGN